MSLLSNNSITNQLFNSSLSTKIILNSNLISTESKKLFIPKKGTYPKGFSAGGIHCGIKKPGIKDLAIIKSDLPCTASAVFTTNSFKAASVLLDKEIISSQPNKKVLGVVINSGCANACTGEKGLKDAKEVSQTVTQLASSSEKAKTMAKSKLETMVMSTGVIGQHLNMDAMKSGIKNLVGKLTHAHDSWMDAATAIMTTDTFPKLRSSTYTLPNGVEYHMAGMCKGAGMIHPNMATMLSTIYSDIAITKECLDKALKYAADRSFNAISVDGDMSTNDTFAVLTNGAAMTGRFQNYIINDVQSPEYAAFQDALTEFATELSKLIVRDGEGATKFVTVQVRGARSFKEAKTVCEAIANSSLVKTAIYGEDANWGRIICAAGYSGVKLDPKKVNLNICNGNGTKKLQIFKNGAPFDVNEEIASQILKEEEIMLDIELGLGNEEARMYTCDFSVEYVHINADYRS